VSDDLVVRAEQPEDRAAVREILCGAFPSEAEADLVDALRGRTTPQVSLVAVAPDGAVVGHIFFTPVAIEGVASALGLAPVAVSSERQRGGVGGALIQEGLRACREAGAQLVVLLGDPDYYPRFGFTPAWDHGLYYGEPGPNPAFQVQALVPGALDAAHGEVRYHSAFDGL
jgi:putative acetyltransferase